MEASKALECCKQRLTGSPGGSSEDQTAKRNVDSQVCAHKALEENKDLVENQTKSHGVTFWQIICLQICMKMNLKTTDLTDIVEKMSRKPNDQAVAWVLWTACGQIYSKPSSNTETLAV